MIAVVVAFTAVKATPLLTELFHEYVPVPAPVSVTDAPAHTVWSTPAFAVGNALIVTAAVPESVLEHAPFETETKLSVCAVVAAVTVTVAVPPAAIVAVVFEPPLIL